MHRRKRAQPSTFDGMLRSRRGSAARLRCVEGPWITHSSVISEPRHATGSYAYLYRITTSRMDHRQTALSCTFPLFLRPLSLFVPTCLLRQDSNTRTTQNTYNTPTYPLGHLRSRQFDQLQKILRHFQLPIIPNTRADSKPDHQAPQSAIRKHRKP